MILTGQDAIEWLEGEARELGVSMLELCREARISPSTYQRWKQGITEPTIFSIRRFSESLSRKRRFLEKDRD